MSIKRRIINPQLVRAYTFDGYPDYTCVWDMCAIPNGDMYASLCTEGFPAGLNARLFKLPAGGDKLVHCVSSRRITVQNPETGVVPHSKIHTTMMFDHTNDKLYYCTYTTSPGLGHEFLDWPQVYNDPMEAYPGGFFVVYDTRTGAYETWGTPVPRQTIYGAWLDQKYRRYYYTTSMNGRLGYVDLEARRFRDAGRVGTAYHIFGDRDGRIFGLTSNGQFWRYDPRADRVDLLKCYAPRKKGDTYKSGSLTIHKIISVFPDGKVLGTCRLGNPMWLFDPYAGDDGSVRDLGNLYPNFTTDDYLPGLGADWNRAATNWIPLMGHDGWVYGWAVTEAQECDVHLHRMHLETGRREDLGLGYIAGKYLGIWVGPGDAGADGRLYWGDCGYEKPRVIQYDPRLLGKVPATIEADIPVSPSSKTGVAPTIIVQPEWVDPWADSKRARVLAVAGECAPHGSCALQSLALLDDRTLLALAAGRSCRLLRHDLSAPEPKVECLFDTGRAGRALHSMARLGDAVYFSLQTAEPVPLFRAAAGGVRALANLPAGGAVTLAADPPRGLLYALTARNTLLALKPDGNVAFETDPICARQLSPTLAIGADGTVWGAQRGCDLWRLAPGGRKVETLPVSVPCQKGRRSHATWQSAALRDGLIYGGSSDGYLFRFDPATRQLANLGKPLLEMEIQALDFAADGALYGIGGAPHSPLYGFGRLFRYDSARGFEDLGRLNGGPYPCHGAIRMASLLAAPDGSLFIGEDDDLAHLWRFTPAGNA